MKIVYISNSIIPSRTANSIHVMKMCQAFADNGHEVVLLAPDVKEQYEKGVEDVYDFYNVKKIFKIDKIKTVNIKGKSFIYSFNAALSIKKYKPDLVYGRDVIGCTLSTIFGNKTSLELHAPIWEQSKFQEYFFKIYAKNKNNNKTVLISDALKKIYEKKYGKDFLEYTVAHDGADEVVDFERKANLEGNFKLNIGYAGHLYKGRGIDIIIELSKLHGDIGFHIFGGNKEDIAYWKKEIINLNIFFYGFIPQSDIVQYRNACDVLLAPYQKKLSISNSSLNTSSYMSPLKVFEYMASKKAIIISDLPVLREILNSDSALFVFPDNIDEWENAINQLKNKHLRYELAHNSYTFFKSHYLWKSRCNLVI